MVVYIDDHRNKSVGRIMTQKQFHQVARALADPQRFAILERIAGERGELACKALVQEFAISQATISHHLKELLEAGLIDCRREAQCAFLSLRRPAMEAYREELGRRMALGPRPKI
jgi:ArsR family transcriptional regulator, arsenate/arsenite/antimonite-responsive transcriptional repressor